MACEKHRHSLSEASLGELDPKSEVEFLAHAAECGACRQSYNHAKELRASIDQAIGAIVAGEPSPHFASRLRARIAAEHAPARSPWRSWAPVAVAALALVALSGTLLIRSSHHDSPVASPTAAAVEPMVPSRAPSSATIQRAENHSSVAPATSAHVAIKQAHLVGPEVLVPRGQLTAAFAVTEAIAKYPAGGRALVAASTAVDEPIDLKEIEVAPLEKPAPIMESEDSGRF